MRFIFFDLETSGLDRTYDLPLSIAAIATDEHLCEIDRISIRVRCEPHVIPDPAAVLVTGIDPTEIYSGKLPALPDAIKLFLDFAARYSPAIFAGYNSIGYDEHLLRQSLYQSLRPPYLTTTGGNRRLDILHVVRTLAAIYVGDVLAIPVGDGGQRFDLPSVCQANSIPHQAHDAMSDVEATLAIARVVYRDAADIWRRAIDMTDRKTLRAVPKTVIYGVAERRDGQVTLIFRTILAPHPDKRDCYITIETPTEPDVDQPPVTASQDEIFAWLEARPERVSILNLKRGNVLMPMTGFHEMARRYPPPPIVATATRMREARSFVQACVAFALAHEKALPVDAGGQVEPRIYEAFFASADVATLAELHAEPPSERAQFLDLLIDDRLREILVRHLAQEAPWSIPQDLVAGYQGWLLDRVAARQERPWRTAHAAIAQIESMIGAGEATHEQIRTLMIYRDMLITKIAEVQRLENNM